MAKALYGHLAADPALVSQVQHLRRRVRDLEAEVERLHAEAEQQVRIDDELVALRDRHPHVTAVLS